jgi:histone H3/H4
LHYTSTKYTIRVTPSLCRWKSGTVAKREIRKLSRTTHLLFPKRPFQRLIREVAQDFTKDMRFTPNSMQAIQEAAEVFVTETFHKADMARRHARRNTVHVQDIRFSRFMTPESLWVVPDRIWETETFACGQGSMSKGGSSSTLGAGTGKKNREVSSSTPLPEPARKKVKASPVKHSKKDPVPGKAAAANEGKDMGVDQAKDEPEQKQHSKGKGKGQDQGRKQDKDEEEEEEGSAGGKASDDEEESEGDADANGDEDEDDEDGDEDENAEQEGTGKAQQKRQ